MPLFFESARVRSSLVVAFVVVAAAVYGQFLFRQATRPPTARPRSTVVRAPDTHGTVPGNPDRAERPLLQSAGVLEAPRTAAPEPP